MDDNTKICSNCGIENIFETKFCPNCGSNKFIYKGKILDCQQATNVNNNMEEQDNNNIVADQMQKTDVIREQNITDNALTDENNFEDNQENQSNEELIEKQENVKKEYSLVEKIYPKNSDYSYIKEQIDEIKNNIPKSDSEFAKIAMQKSQNSSYFASKILQNENKKYEQLDLGLRKKPYDLFSEEEKREKSINNEILRSKQQANLDNLKEKYGYEAVDYNKRNEKEFNEVKQLSYNSTYFNDINKNDKNESVAKMTNELIEKLVSDQKERIEKLENKIEQLEKEKQFSNETIVNLKIENVENNAEIKIRNELIERLEAQLNCEKNTLSVLLREKERDSGYFVHNQNNQSLTKLNNENKIEIFEEEKYQAEGIEYVKNKLLKIMPQIENDANNNGQREVAYFIPADFKNPPIIVINSVNEDSKNVKINVVIESDLEHNQIQAKIAGLDNNAIAQLSKEISRENVQEDMFSQIDNGDLTLKEDYANEETAVSEDCQIEKKQSATEILNKILQEENQPKIKESIEKDVEKDKKQKNIKNKKKTKERTVKTNNNKIIKALLIINSIIILASLFVPVLAKDSTFFWGHELFASQIGLFNNAMANDLFVYLSMVSPNNFYVYAIYISYDLALILSVLLIVFCLLKTKLFKTTLIICILNVIALICCEIFVSIAQEYLKISFGLSISLGFSILLLVLMLFYKIKFNEKKQQILKNNNKNDEYQEETILE